MLLTPDRIRTVAQLEAWFAEHGAHLPLHLDSSELPESFFQLESTDLRLRRTLVDPITRAYGEWPFGASEAGYLERIAEMHRDPRFVLLRGMPGKWSVTDLVNRHGCRTIVEVGVSDGHTAVEILGHCNGVSKYYLVDHWLTAPRRHRMLQTCLKDNPLVTIVRSPSVEAARQFEDGSLDLVYIDAGHSFRDVTADIEAWWPKVAADGVLCGDDYQNVIFPESDHNGVRRAVNAAFPKERIRWSFATPINPIFYVVNS
ncbi:MAG TPA: class I SAM-dependent methyltransferase [Candidatus Polarisedimenticolia bacterium]|nr:class I SAM-dependent methyltransferase [Candidatus Polarisedimenticolia bacterium]